MKKVLSAFAVLGIVAAVAASLLVPGGGLEVGKTAPDFAAQDQDGASFKLSDYRGKVVVLDFWGFW